MRNHGRGGGRLAEIRFRCLILLAVAVMLLMMISSVRSQKVADNQDEIKPSFPKLFFDSISQFRRSNQDSWTKIKSMLNQFQLKFTPPNLDFRGTGNGGKEEGGKVMDAVGKSFNTGRATVEESAKSAAKGVEKVVQKTAEMVKDSVSDEDDGGHPHHQSQTEL